MRGGVATLGAQALVAATGLLGTMVLARLLTPSDFGLVAMVAALRGVTDFLVDAGLPTATVQRPEINHRQISTLFWINVSLGLAFGALFVLLAGSVARFYSDPRLELIAIVSAAGIPLAAVGVQHRALLRRQMHFGKLATLRVLAAVSSTAVAIALALSGFHYWALVAMQLTRTGLIAAGAWWQCDWRPGLPARKLHGIEQMLRFGINLTGVQVTNFVRRNVDKVLIGKFVDASTLGLYAKASNLLQMPINYFNTPLSAVAVPALSRLTDDPERYRRFYRKAVQFPLMIGMPTVAFGFLATPELVQVVLGNQWVDAVPLFRAFMPAAFIATTTSITTWVFISRGNTHKQFRQALAVNTATVAGIFVGLQWGALGVALAISAVQCCARIPSIAYCFRGTPLRLTDLVAAGWRPAWSTCFAAASAFLIALSMEATFSTWHPVMRLGFYAFSFAIAYPLAWIAMPGGWASAKALVTLSRDLRR